MRDPDRRHQMAHRVAYEYAVGPVAPGLLVLHACDNPPCVNPDHLFTGTQKENIADMDRKGRRRSRPLTGADAGRAVLTPELADEILILSIQGWTQARLAERFGVSRGTIYNVQRGTHWASHA